MKKTIIKRIAISIVTLALTILGFTHPEVQKTVKEVISEIDKNTVETNKEK